MRKAAVVLLILAVGIIFWGRSIQPADPDEFRRVMNLGKALLENRNAAESVKTFEHAVSLNRTSPRAWRNLSRAYYLARKHEQMIEALDRTDKIEAESAAANYLRGLGLNRLSRFGDAVPYFERAVQLDPTIAAARFQLANAYQSAEAHERAMQQYKETIRLDPFHASAHYKLAAYARAAGNREEMRHHHEEFMRLRTLFGESSRSADALERCVHTEPEAIERVAAAPLNDPINVSFADLTDESVRASSLAVLDVQESGRARLIGADKKGALTVHYVEAGAIKNTPVKTSASPASRCLAGDFFNELPEGATFSFAAHARADLLCYNDEGAQLLMQGANSGFKDVETDLAARAATAAKWVDYDHDGDLDLLLGGASGLRLWQNNGNGTFSDVTEANDFPDTGPVADLAIEDLDQNVAVDIIVARDAQPTLILENKYGGRFDVAPSPPGPWPAARLLLSNDLDNDGFPDVVMIGESEINVGCGRTHQIRVLAPVDETIQAAALVDYDNDGHLDLMTASSTDIHLLRNNGQSVWTHAGVPLPHAENVTQLVPADVDGDGDTDVAAATSDGPLRILLNEGGNANRSMTIRLEPLKSNPSGLNTHVELRDADFWVTRSTHSPFVIIGMGARERVDAVQTLWTNGVVDNQINVDPSNRVLTIAEKNVATGSCPFLYAWDGQRYRFVTDILGNSPIGLPMSRHEVLSADPDEFVEIGDSNSFPPKNGSYSVQVTSEFREVVYLDAARLVAVDHPRDVEIHSTDKLMPGPFEPSELVALGNRIDARSIMGDDGIDRTSALRDIDGAFSLPGEPLPPPYRGMCRPLALTLDFGTIDSSKPVVLALTGWLQYGDGSTNIALSQDPDVVVEPPTLSVEIGEGIWRNIDVVVGMPAGKTKTILVDLTGKTPSNARRLRLSTTFELRWDRIALFQSIETSNVLQQELRPVSAELYERGFSDLRTRAPASPTTPDFDDVSAIPAWRNSLYGWCTRFGPVGELVSEIDDKLVVFNGGDAVSLSFEPLPPVTNGQQRTFFFYSFGWEKDGDHNVVDGDSVAPLPVSNIAFDSMEETSAADWRLKYNTRWTAFDRFRPTRRSAGQ